MARYYFNLYDGADILDDEGYEFCNLEEVRSQAIHFIGNAMVDAGRRVFCDGSWRLEVTDEVGAVMLSVQVRAIDTLMFDQKTPSVYFPLSVTAAAA